ncbi:MAG: anti-sigma factor [Ahrensia sp.]|nr:anti-sigma factor [Ahrensia sp.]
MSKATQTKSERENLCAEYALGVLPLAERLAFEKQLKDDADLRSLLEAWEIRLAPIGDNYKSVPAPASILSKVESKLFERPDLKLSWWNSIVLWRGLTAGLLASTFGLLVIINNISSPTVQTSPGFIAEIKSETSDLRVAALYESSSQTLRLNRISGAPANTRAFELWLIAGDQPPISLGVLPEKKEFRISLSPELSAKLVQNALFAISDEPEDGSPTGQPTGAVLAVGQIAKI